MGTYVDEFRGTDHLVFAEVLTDDNNGYTTGPVSILAPVAEISKTVETSSDTKYYDNHAALTINAEGADTITLTVPAIDLKTLAAITGKNYDEATGAFMDGTRTPKYFALGYRLRLTDGSYRYVWRYKGSFAIPDETSQTENAGTDSNNQQLTYTGIATMFHFLKTGSSEKALVVDERDTEVSLTGFFDIVTTCDIFGGNSYVTVANSLVNVSSTNSAASAKIGDPYSATLTADEDYTISNVTVVMNGADVTSSAWTSGTGAVAITAVTGPIIIAAVAIANT